MRLEVIATAVLLCGAAVAQTPRSSVLVSDNPTDDVTQVAVASDGELSAMYWISFGASVE